MKKVCLALSLLTLSPSAANHDTEKKASRTLDNIVDEVVSDSTFYNKKFTNEFSEQIDFWYKNLTTDTSKIISYRMNCLEQLDIFKKPERKERESVEEYDRRILKDIHEKHGRIFNRWDKVFGITYGKRQEVKEGLIRSSRYLPFITERFKEENIPLNLAAKPLFESLYDPEAESKAGAKGIWQFMEGTAKDYGLEIKKGIIDERMDPYSSTDAYIKYMKEAFRKFEGKPLLALVSYNTGKNSRYFRNWRMRDQAEIIRYMGFAPMNYYAGLAASIKVMKKMREHFSIDIHLEDIQRKKIHDDVHGYELEDHLGLPKEEIMDYNPQLKEGLFDSAYNLKGKTITLPKMKKVEPAEIWESYRRENTKQDKLIRKENHIQKVF
ncbi:MAG: transglycosylase SLT domain-containing protein [Nanobdellota archaeon]